MLKSSAVMVVTLTMLAWLCTGTVRAEETYTLENGQCRIVGTLTVVNSEHEQTAVLFDEQCQGALEDDAAAALLGTCLTRIQAAAQGDQHTHTVTAYAPLTNRALHPAAIAHLPFYRRLFAVDDHFRGTRAFSLNNATLTVNGDGDGGLLLQVNDAPHGTYTQTLSVAADCTFVTEEQTVRSFRAHYTQADTALPTSALFDSLEDALAHAKADGLPHTPLRITVDTDHTVRGICTVSDGFDLVLTYGQTLSSATVAPTASTLATTTTRTTAPQTAVSSTAQRTTRRRFENVSRSTASPRFPATSSTPFAVHSVGTTASAASIGTTTAATTTAAPSERAAVMVSRRTVTPTTSTAALAAASPTFSWDVKVAVAVLLGALTALAVGLYRLYRARDL